MASSADVLSLQFPVGGLWKRAGYRAHPPFYSPDCLNVRPDDPLESRDRGGSRGGSAKFSATQLGGAGTREIRLIYELRYDSGNGYLKILLAAADNGVLYMYSPGGGTWSAIATANVTLASGRQLQAADILGYLYISSDTNGNIAVYDPATDTLDTIGNTHTVVGTAPTNCHGLARYRQRLLLAVDQANPHRWYISRQGVPYDFEYGQVDAQTAVAGHLSDSGTIEEPVIAMIPHGDDCCLFGCSSSIWTMRSDPAYGGSIDNISREVGLSDRLSWCHDADKQLWFLSHDGVYWMPPGCGDFPISVSREVMPEELLTADRSTSRISMAYDVYHRGVRLSITNDAASAGTHFWIDTKVREQRDRGGPWGAFFPFTYPLDAEPMYFYNRPDSPQASSVCLMGSRDGFIRVESSTLKTDATEAGTQSFDSYVMLGPFALGKLSLQGLITTLETVLSESSDSVSIEIRVGSSAERAISNAPVEILHCDNIGWNRHRPRHRGTYATLKVKNRNGSSLWAVEELILHRLPSAAPRRFEQ